MANNTNYYDFYITPAGEHLLLGNLISGSSVRFHQVAVGTASYDPTLQVNQVSLLAEVDRVLILDAEKVDKTWQLATVFDGSGEYNVGEIGIITDTGVLFAVHSTPNKLLGSKAESGRFYPRLGLSVEQLPEGAITVNLAGDNANLIITPELAKQTVAYARLANATINSLGREIKAMKF